MRNLLPSVRLASCAVAVTLIALVVQTSPSGASNVEGRVTSVVSSAKAPRLIEMYATYYGWYDNSPPGCATAYSGCAGGTGTRAHPITFASDKNELPVGTILYYPTVEKYFVMGDDCQECDEDWAGKGPDGGPHFRHADLWTGGKGGNEFDAINCEDALTQGLPNGAPVLTPFIVNPPSDMPVSTEALFDARTNHCYGGATTSATNGRYRNGKSGECLEDAHDSSKPPTPAQAAPCTAAAAEDLTFDGAFFVINKLCLQAEGATAGSALDFASCNGKPHQQWEVNPNGTIAGIQSNRCIADDAGKIELAKCTGAPANQWSFKAESAH
jgi:hypothetical protein